MLLNLVFNITYKSPSNTQHYAIRYEKRRILVFVDLLQI